VCLLGCANLFVGFAAPRLFHFAHASDFRFGAGDFVVGNLATLFFVSVFASFSFDPLPLVFSARAREFLFNFAPAFLLDAESVLCRKSFGFDLRSAGRFFGLQSP
jgi:hypothetical protein